MIRLENIIINYLINYFNINIFYDTVFQNTIFIIWLNIIAQKNKCI